MTKLPEWKSITAVSSASKALTSRTPRWQHDCDACVFLASVRLNQHYDVYICPSCDGGSILARYGNEGSEYASTMLVLLERHITESFAAYDTRINRVSYEILPYQQAWLIALLQYGLFNARQTGKAVRS